MKEELEFPSVGVIRHEFRGFGSIFYHFSQFGGSERFCADKPHPKTMASLFWIVFVSQTLSRAIPIEKIDEIAVKLISEPVSAKQSTTNRSEWQIELRDWISDSRMQ